MNDILHTLLTHLERCESLAQATILTHEGRNPATCPCSAIWTRP